MVFLIQELFAQNQTVTFNYTGGMQTWTVPPCVNTITITAAGAKGGGSNGGNGAQVSGTINVTPGQVLNIFVGGMGILGNNSGGFNGGGTGFASTDGNTNYSSWGGGGASDVRIGGIALGNRIIVAGGGGGRSGGSSPVCGGAASSANCVDGGQGCSTYGTGALGGSQFAGGAGGTPWAGTPPGGSPGSLGQGGQAGLWQTASGGGGGGGYYGGGGGGNDGCCTGANGGGGGGGGSSLLPPGGTCSGALNANNGYVTITYIPGFTVTASNTGPYCTGSTIQLEVQAVNLPAGATYSWSGPSSFTSNASNPTISNASASNGGTYSVQVTAPGCSATANTVVTINPAPAVSAGADQNICQNSTVSLTATGASSYAWTSGVSNGVAFTPPLGTSTYTVTGTNSASGCTATDDVTVTVSPLPTLNAGNDTSICAGQSITFNAIASAGSNLFWSNGVTNGVPVTPGSTTSYFVTATSPQNCVAFDIIQVTVNPVPAVYAGADQTICQGTSVTLSGIGATTYQWNNGVTNGVSFAPPVGTNTYTMTGFSAQNCSSTDNVVITVNPSPVPIINGATTYCQNNPTSLSTTASFSNYSWSTGSNSASITATQANNPITVTVTNQFNCSGTSAPITLTQLPSITANSTISICSGQSATIHGIAQNIAGTYSATFQTSNGCDSTSNVTLSLIAPPSVNAGTDQTVCQGSVVTLTGSGANSYLWDNGVSDGVAFTPPLGTTTYTLTGTSGQNCSNTDQVTVTVNPNPLPVISGSTTYCQNSTAPLSTTLSYNSYNWSTGGNGASISVTQANNPITVTVTNQFNCSATSAPFTVTQLATIVTNSNLSVCQGQSATIHGLAQNTAGTYSATFQTANGCDSTSNVTLTVQTLPTVNAGIDQTICQGNTVTLTGSGANTYQWNNGITNGVAFNPPLGTTLYTVTGTAGNNCQASDEVAVTVNATPTVNAGMDITICVGESVTLTASGATNYSWDNGITNGQEFNPSTTTLYTVTGSSNGCIGTDDVLVTLIDAPTASISGDENYCLGETINPIVVNVGAGFASYSLTYSLNGQVQPPLIINGSSTTITSPTTTGTYEFQLISVSSNGANQCSSQPIDSVIIQINPNPVIDAGEDLVLCEPSGGNPDEITLEGSGGVSYIWNNGVTNGVPFIPVSGTTTYTVTGTDANGCSGTDQLTVNALPLPDANGNATVTFGHVTLNTTLENLSSNATQYVWHFGDGDSLVTNNLSSINYSYTEPGIYLVELVASNGICQDVWTQEIEVIAPMTVTPPNVFTPNGDGSNDTYFVDVENGATFYGLILNRWGNKIMELTELNQGWDGSVDGNLFADGVYFIEYRATDFNGNDVTGHTYFHLIR